MKKFITLLVIVCGCGPKLSSSDAYAADHLACVAQFKSKADIDKCRQEVRFKWGVSDGGS